MTQITLPATCSSDFTVGGISDIHAGHRNTRTRYIANHFDVWMVDHHKKLTDLDLFVIAGDLFDKALSYPSEDVLLVSGMIDRLMRFCEQHNIVFRILEGTFSHDRKQSANLELLTVQYPQLDYKYVDYLSIESHPTLGIDILYLPDEWNTTTGVTQQDIVHLLRDKQLDQVDLIVMHGQFSYQIPLVPGLDFHDQYFFESICRTAVIVGHVHKHIIDGRIIPPGSFDGLNHGEESVAKGGVWISVVGDQMVVQPLVNRQATVYLSIELTGDVSRDEDLIKMTIDPLPENSFVRLLGPRDNTHISTLPDLAHRYPGISFSTKITGSSATVPTSFDLPVVNYESKPLTRSNMLSGYQEYLGNTELSKPRINSLVARLREYL